MKRPSTPSTWTKTRASSSSTSFNDSRRRANPERARVLAVDDHADLCEILSLFLEQAGFSVATSCTAHDAWHILTLQAGSVDVMIADATLSETNDGIRLVERARKRFPRIKSIVLSGNTAIRKRALKAGADSVLIKPVPPSVLVAEIIRLDRQSNAR